MTQVDQNIRKFALPVSSITNNVGMASLAVMMFLIASDVILRYVFNRPITGSFEITEFLMVIVVAFALAYTGVQKGHVRIDILISHFPPRVQAFIYSVAYLLSAGFLLLITWRSALYAESLRVGEDTSAALMIPVFPFVWVVVCGSAIFSLILLIDLLDYLRQATEKTRWWAQAGLLFGVILVSLLFSVPLFRAALLWQMSPIHTGLFGIFLLIVFLFSGIPIAVVMGLIGFLGMSYVGGLGAGLCITGTTPYTQMSTYSLSVIPLFVLMGMFCHVSELSRELYYAAYKWLGHLRGGLAMTTIGACSAFAAVSGSSLATVATMGKVALPEMERYKYDSRLATGCIAAGGTIGILIPPSVVLVVYGILTEQSIGKLFLAGFIPGVLQGVFYMITIAILCKQNLQLGPSGVKSSLKDKFISLKASLGVIGLFVLVIGGIYAGVFTPTEAAGIGAFGAFIFALVRRKLSWQRFTLSLSDTTKTTAMVFFMLIGATMLSYFLAITRLPFEVSTFVAQLAVNRYIILGAILLIYLFLGAIMHSLAMIVLTVPIFFPVIESLGFNPIWFGIIIVKVVEMAMITPPYGINVFVLRGIAPHIALSTMFKGIFPFLIADLFHVAILIMYPQISLFLPNLAR